ncbi:MAG: NusG domain II-containing protein [Lachnospiraceae bacterium]|nr:NusG domain II-containing protein [Lachnospiraceae bacterium]
MKHMFDCVMIESDKKQRIRKADIIFVLIIGMVALIGFFILQMYSKEGSYAVVSYDGTERLIQIPLEQSEPRYFLITYKNTDNEEKDIENTDMQEFSEEEWAKFQEESLPSSMEYNVFLYKNQEISMLYSSCPDKICVHHRAISMTGENIICLPHKLVIEITGDGERQTDGVAY